MIWLFHLILLNQVNFYRRTRKLMRMFVCNRYSKPDS